MSWIEELLFFNRAAIYDIATIFGFVGFLLGLANVRFASRRLSIACAWTFVLALLSASFIWAAESHYTFVQAQMKKGGNPYFLAGYYGAK